VTLFNRLGRTTVWNLVEKIPFEGDMGEPEGMVRLGDDRYFVSAGDFIVRPVRYDGGAIINGTDRSPGFGFAHLIVFDGKGTRIADATHSNVGDIEYHPGGIDYDGEFIWSTIAQYRPNTTAHIIRIDPRTLEATTVFRANDHYGGAVHDTKTDRLLALNWGSRNSSTWNLKSKSLRPDRAAEPESVVRNPSFFIDYQDCKFLGHPPSVRS
jgi:hypothetical protein